MFGLKRRGGALDVAGRGDTGVGDDEGPGERELPRQFAQPRERILAKDNPCSQLEIELKQALDRHASIRGHQVTTIARV